LFLDESPASVRESTAPEYHDTPSRRIIQAAPPGKMPQNKRKKDRFERISISKKALSHALFPRRTRSGK